MSEQHVGVPVEPSPQKVAAGRGGWVGALEKGLRVSRSLVRHRKV